MSDKTHGTWSAYQNGCRCDDCKAAASERRLNGSAAEYEAGLTKVPPLFLAGDRTQAADPDDWRHGTVTAYSQGCRCPWCRDAGVAYRTARRLGYSLGKGFNARDAEHAE